MVFCQLHWNCWKIIGYILSNVFKCQTLGNYYFYEEPPVLYLKKIRTTLVLILVPNINGTGNLILRKNKKSFVVLKMKPSSNSYLSNLKHNHWFNLQLASSSNFCFKIMYFVFVLILVPHSKKTNNSIMGSNSFGWAPTINGYCFPMQVSIIYAILV